jgi:hypothetical protein
MSRLGTCAPATRLESGYTVPEPPTREAALDWAASRRRHAT